MKRKNSNSKSSKDTKSFIGVKDEDVKIIDYFRDNEEVRIFSRRKLPSYCIKHTIVGVRYITVPVVLVSYDGDDFIAIYENGAIAKFDSKDSVMKYLKSYDNDNYFVGTVYLVENIPINSNIVSIIKYKR